MLTIETRDDLFAAMKSGATVITPNNRLSNQLLHDYYKQNQSCVTLGFGDKPHCLPYSAWLIDLFKKARHLYANKQHPTLLTYQQQRYLWQYILSQNNQHGHDGLLSEIQDAWTRCQNWQIDPQHPAFNQTPQTKQFQWWQQQVMQKMKELGALSEEQLANHLLSYPHLFNACRSEEEGLRFIWVCFDDYTPQQRTLQQAITSQGCQQYHYDLSHHPHVTHQYPANDGQDEYLHMIQWIKEKLASGEERIAVVIPDLQSESKPLQRLLQRHFLPHQFNISLGQPLIDYPLIAHALHWLHLDQCVISNHQARLLLHSPYLLGAKTEFTARAEAMQDSPILQENTFTLSSFIKALPQSAPKLAALLTHLSVYPLKASPASWINHFKNRLVDLGFPGEYPLHSANYQCFQRFNMLMDELLPLSLINPLMSKNEALHALNNLAKSTIFQAQKSTTPIQILGLLEASGCTFDSVWVSGLTDQCLPQKTRLSAFIPIALQREYQMPHAVAERELQFARQLLLRLQHGSHDSVFSYPRLTGDIPNLPCPPIQHLVCKARANRTFFHSQWLRASPGARHC